MNAIRLVNPPTPPSHTAQPHRPKLVAAFPGGAFIRDPDDRRIVVRALMSAERALTTRPTGIRASEVLAIRALLARAHELTEAPKAKKGS